MGTAQSAGTEMHTILRMGTVYGKIGAWPVALRALWGRRIFSIGTLRWAVGAWLIALGALMLVAPYQLGISIQRQLYMYSPWLGLGCVVLGFALWFIVVYDWPQPVVMAIHILAGGVLVALGRWFGLGPHLTTSHYLTLGAMTAITPFLPGAQLRDPQRGRLDLFSVALGIDAIISAVVLFTNFLNHAPSLLPWFATPSWFPFAPLPIAGIALFLAGIGVVATQCRDSGAGRRAQVAHAILGLMMIAGFSLALRPTVDLAQNFWPTLAFRPTVDVAQNFWSTLFYYVGFGVALALWPRYGPDWQTKSRYRFAIRYGFPMSVLSIAPFLIAFGVVSGSLRDVSSQATRDAETAERAGVAATIGGYFGDRQRALAAIATPDLDVRTENEQQQLLDHIHMVYPEMRIVAIVKRLDRGRYAVRLSRDSQIQPGDLSPGTGIDAIFQTDKTVLGHLSSGLAITILHAPTLPGYPLVQVVGIIPTDSVNDMLRANTDGWAYLISANGFVVASSNSLVAPGQALWDKKPVKTLLDDIRMGHPASGQMDYVDNETWLVAGYTPIPSLDTTLLVERPVTHPNGDPTLVVMFVTLLVAIGISVVYTNWFTGRISDLTAAVHSFTTLSKPPRLPEVKIRELAELSDAFTEMWSRIHSAYSERIPVGLYRTRVDGTIVAVNAAFARMFGADNADGFLARTRNAKELYWNSKDRPKWQKKVEAQREDLPHRSSMLARRLDGTKGYFMETAIVATDVNGEPFYEGALVDETDTVHERTILKSVMEAMTVGIVVADADGCVEYYNSTVAAWFGLDRRIIGKPFVNAFARATVVDGPVFRADLQNEIILDALRQKADFDVRVAGAPERVIRVRGFDVDFDNQNPKRTGLILTDVTADRAIGRGHRGMDRVATHLREDLESVCGMRAIRVEIFGSDGTAILLQQSGAVAVWDDAQVTFESRSVKDTARTHHSVQFAQIQPNRLSQDVEWIWYVPFAASGRLLGLGQIAGAGPVPDGERDRLTHLAGFGGLAIWNARAIAEAEESRQQISELFAGLYHEIEARRVVIATVLHQDVVQPIATAGLFLNTLGEDYPMADPKAQELLAKAIQVVIGANAAARGILGGSGNVGDIGLEAVRIVELDHLIAGLSSQMEGEGYVVARAIDPVVRELPDDSKETIYRVCQEAFANITKHAGVLCAIRIDLQRVDGIVRLTISDEGRGFDPAILATATSGEPGEHVGLATMRQRVMRHKGRFEIKTGPNQGTVIVVEIPWSTGHRREEIGE